MLCHIRNPWELSGMIHLCHDLYYTALNHIDRLSKNREEEEKEENEQH